MLDRENRKHKDLEEAGSRASYGLVDTKVKVKSLGRVRLCDPMDCSPPGSSVHGISQARVLEWGAYSLNSNLTENVRSFCIIYFHLYVKPVIECLTVNCAVCVNVLTN